MMNEKADCDKSNNDSNNGRMLPKTAVKYYKCFTAHNTSYVTKCGQIWGDLTNLGAAVAQIAHKIEVVQPEIRMNRAVFSSFPRI